MLSFLRNLGSAIACATLFAFVGVSNGQAQDTIKVGVIQPTAGVCAQWGIPVIEGAKMWANEHNQQGGILVGDGNRYLLEVLAYDNVCYVPGEEIKAARRAVADGVAVILQTFTPASREAIAEIVNEAKILTTSYGAGWLSEDYPYLIGGISGAPASMMQLTAHVAKTRPELTRYAFLVVDLSFGLAGRAYALAGVAPHSDTVEVVFDQLYNPDATADMLGLLTPVFQSNPDVVVELGFSPAQKAVLLEISEQFGFEGVLISEGWSNSYLEERVSLDAFQGRLYQGYSIDGEEPSYSPRAHEAYKRWVEENGPENWSVYTSIAYSVFVGLEESYSKATGPSGEELLAALTSTDTIEHPLFGPSRWGGGDIFGADHHLLTPMPIYLLGDNNSYVVDAVADLAQWWEENGEKALPVLDSGGQVYK
jgi:branched-chain amino acid transport system substrate-binding protein